MSSRVKITLLLLPAVSVISVLFLGGLLAGILRSFNYMPTIGLNEPDLSAYKTLLTDRETYLSFALSVYIALVSTAISTILAVAAALLLRRHFFGRVVARFLFQLNLTVPHLVGAIGMLYLLSQSGSFARLGASWGMIASPADFPALVFDPLAIGIILQYVWKEVPFIGLIVLANLQTIGEEYEQAARTLGATAIQSFRYVLFPMLAPATLSASVIVFAFTFGAYEVPAILGASFPVALPVLAYQKYTDVDLGSRPEAMAIAILIAVMSTVLIYLYLRLARRQIGR